MAIINLPILKIIKKEQLEHGLRHRDYSQYRKYCTNRARRFRKFFQKNQISMIFSRFFEAQKSSKNIFFIQVNHWTSSLAIRDASLHVKSLLPRFQNLRISWASLSPILNTIMLMRWSWKKPNHHEHGITCVTSYEKPQNEPVNFCRF